METLNTEMSAMGPVPKIGPILTELLRSRGQSRGAIRAKAEELAAAIWRSHASDRERQETVGYVIERLVFDP